MVSIPNRDFGELQCTSIEGIDEAYDVSIPNRDFGELQSLACESPAVFSFQGAVARTPES